MDIKTSQQKITEFKEASKTASKDILTGSAYTAAEVGQRATASLNDMRKDVFSTTRHLSGTVGSEIVNRTPDIYDIGSQGEGEITSEGAGALIGNSVMAGRTVYRKAKGATGIVVEQATKRIISDKKLENRKKEKDEFLENIKENGITSKEIKDIDVKYKDILIGRSRKDIASYKDRVSLSRTKQNDFSGLSFEEKMQVMKAKHKAGKYDRSLLRREKWMSHSSYMKNTGFHTKSIRKTLGNQTRKFMNRPGYTMRRGGDQTIATAYDIAQKGVRGGAKSVFFTIKHRKKFYKGAKSVVYAIRHPVASLMNVLRMIAALFSSLVSFLVSIPAMVTSIITLLPLIIVVIVVVTVVTTLFGWWNEITKVKIEAIGITSEVLSYEQVIEDSLDKWWDDDWKQLVMAVMMQESAGKGCDPMQASESEYNQLYPREPAGTSCKFGITDSDYSIEIGIKHLRDSMRRAGVEEPDDMKRLPYALQGYNFGNGWFREYDEWTADNARNYSEKINGGDPDYPYHVLRYYSVGGVGGAVDNMPDFTNKNAWKAPYNPYAPEYYGQCTWFAWGRFYEIYGYSPGFNGNGNQCAGQLLMAHPDKFMPSYSEPKAGSVFSIIGTKNDPKSHTGIIISYDGENVTWQDGNYNNATDDWDYAITDWRQQTDTLENFKKRYAGPGGVVLFANPVEPPQKDKGGSK